MSLSFTHHKVNSESTTDFEVSEITFSNNENLVLTGRIATVDDNRGFASAMNVKFGKDGSKKRRSSKALEAAVREIYPFHVFTGWNAVDDSGNPVPYDAEKCRDQIMKVLSPYSLTDIALHFSDPNNFREALTVGDGTDLGNESGG